MKKLLLLSTLFLCGQVTAQCVKLYVKEHLSGSPICNLSSGDWIEICEQSNEVNGCPRNFYIFSKGSSSGSLTYELSLDRGWSTHYMTLMVNPSTKRFGFILQGQTAMYSYYTKNDVDNKTSDNNNEYRRHRQWLEEQRQFKIMANKLSDKEKYPIIDEALTSGNWELVTKTIDNLNYPKSYPNYNTYEKLLDQKRQEVISQIEAKIPSQILEASELWVENENILFPLNSSSRNILDRLEKGFINHFSQDTININVISSSSIDNDFLKSLKQGKHSIKGNLNENGDYPFSEDFKKEIGQKSLIKGKAVHVYKPFRIDFIVEIRDSILVNTEYSIGQPTTLGEINMNKQERIYNKNGFSGEYIYIKGENLKNPNYYYKSKSGLKTIQANWEKNVPKDVIIIKSTFKNEKWLNNAFKIQEKNYTVVEHQIIMKKEK